MNKSTGTIFSILSFLLISFIVSGQSSDQWHYPLYLSNMDYWHSRIPVAVKNSSAQDVFGEPVIVTIGNGAGQLHISGKDASGIRVIDSDGTELLWRITSPAGGIVTDKSIPDNSIFTLPVTIRHGLSMTYYVYYDNPAAWPIGAVLEEERYGKKDKKQVALNKGETLRFEIKPTQIMSLTENGRNEEWPGDKKWDIRVPIKVYNFGKSKTEILPVYVKMEQVYLRLHNYNVQSAPLQLGNKAL